MKTVDVTILMPCLNEVETLEYCIGLAANAKEALQAIGYSSEILISDNGSTDGSVDLAKKLGAKVVNCPIKGYGNALIHGCYNASGKYILMADADGSYDFSEGVPMIRKLSEGYDLCMGTRLKGKIMPGAMPWKNRYIGNPVLTGVLNLLYKSGLSDAHSGLRAFTKDAFLKMNLKSPGMEFASEMVVKASVLKLKTTEIPITLFKDKRTRPPHLRPFRDGWRHLKFLLLFSPLSLFLLPAVLLGAFGVSIYGVLIFFAPAGGLFELFGTRIGDHWAIVAGGAITVAYQLVFFGAWAHLYSENSENLPNIGAVDFYKKMKMEHILVIGGFLMLCSLSLFIWCAYSWAKSDFRNILLLRQISFATTLGVIGTQTVFGSFLFSVLGAAKNEATITTIET